MSEKTLSIIKPDAVKKQMVGFIYGRFEAAGLEIIAAKTQILTLEQASGFYAEHKERPFFNDLVAYMTSGLVFIQVLQADGAVMKYRELMGHTDPAQADKGTLRQQCGASIEANAVHGSDSLTSAEREISFFFPEITS